MPMKFFETAGGGKFEDEILGGKVVEAAFVPWNYGGRQRGEGGVMLWVTALRVVYEKPDGENSEPDYHSAGPISLFMPGTTPDTPIELPDGDLAEILCDESGEYSDEAALEYAAPFLVNITPKDKIHPKTGLAKYMTAISECGEKSRLHLEGKPYDTNLLVGLRGDLTRIGKKPKAKPDGTPGETLGQLVFTAIVEVPKAKGSAGGAVKAGATTAKGSTAKATEAGKKTGGKPATDDDDEPDLDTQLLGHLLLYFESEGIEQIAATELYTPICANFEGRKERTAALARLQLPAFWKLPAVIEAGFKKEKGQVTWSQ